MSRDNSQNHYGPNASFDGYDSDLASAGILIESLRQQLADMQGQRDRALDTCATRENEVISLEQAHADHLKREVMLREALTESRRELDSCQKVIWLASDYGFDPAYVKGAQASIRKTDEALAATADLDGVILCHAEPVAWLHEKRPDADVITTAVKNVWNGVVVGKDSLYSIPLYVQKGMTK